MNCTLAKKIPITSFLIAIGYYPVSNRTNQLVYKSPFREEKHGSFFVDPQKNIWKDFGNGQGGTIIDLICLLYKTNISEALSILSKGNFSTINTCIQTVDESRSKVKIVRIRPLQNMALLAYCHNRSISSTLSKKYLQEAYYQVNNKKYFSLAFLNRSGGYELRNKYFKGCSSPKDISYIKGENSNSLDIYEGFFDFLSSLHYHKTNSCLNDSIILNSTALIRKVIDLVPKYENIYYYGDNDQTGNEVFVQLKRNANNIFDKRKTYFGYKDFNQFLTSSQ